MRNEVITFLSDESIRPEGQYNQALSFYMRSENANPGVVRYHNVSGYSPQRLSELVYDLKQAYGIADADLVKKAPKVVQLIKKQVPRFKVPEWSTGAPGNKERKEYCKVNEIEAASGKNADLDIAIQDFIDNANAKHLEVTAAETIQREATVRETAFSRVVKAMSEGQKVTPEMKAEIFAGIDITEDEQNKMIEKASANVLGDVPPEGTDVTTEATVNANEITADTEKK
ncbi:hypothetical protein ACFFVB_18410 [Formosa undariae]|uniref:Uncharacterized protein n=1 Tax=Formosa undariae TaxID=1325436 RepID=A0ABV5F6H8_9FLAO